MWIFTPDGFFSAVEHRDDKNKIMVRMRSRMHAERFVAACPQGEVATIVETPPPADYQFRVTVSRQAWGQIVAKFASEVSYPNFKNEAAKRENPSGFVSALHGVWSEMMAVQTGRPRFTSSSHAPLSFDKHQIEYEYEDYCDVVPGMIVEIEGSPLGEAEVLEVDDEDIATIRFFDLGGEVVRIPVESLVVLCDEDDASQEDHETSRVQPETYDTVEELMAADDGSWPPPVLSSTRGAREEGDR